MKNIVVFASGSGTNFQSVIDAVYRNEIDANLSGLITNKDHIGAIERAQKFSIPHRVLDPNQFEDKRAYSNLLQKQLKSWNCDLIVLAGYLKKIPSEIIRNYKNRILNIHPALLPKFGGKGYYGLNIHKAVIAAGEKESGCSVHIVTDEFDAGPVLAQAKVPVFEHDTPEELAKRVLEQEHKLLPKVINEILTKL